MKIALIILFISWLLRRGCINLLSNDITARIKYSLNKGFISWFIAIVNLVYIISLIIVVIKLIFILF